eukprot:scaffold108810_cov25-Prasinocladus_malaysianus.AAC.2
MGASRQRNTTILPNIYSQQRTGSNGTDSSPILAGAVVKEPAIGLNPRYRRLRADAATARVSSTGNV